MANEQKTQTTTQPIRKDEALLYIEEGGFNSSPKWGNLLIDILTVEEEGKEASVNRTNYNQRRAS